MNIKSSLTLPCGLTAPNRIAKAAMTEGLAECRGGMSGIAGQRIARCYSTWAEGGIGMLITGNIMVDRRYRERPANVVVDGVQNQQQRDGLAAFAAAAKSGGGLAIAQISHAGRQSPKSIAPEPVGPSAVKVELPGGLFGTPRALYEAEILEVIERFATTAAELCTAGFDGVQVHSAHGYLLSEFLNPRVNQRSDRWGGALENRSRLVLDTVRAVRDAIGPHKALSVKLNSSDFQKGGFSFADCQQVVGLLQGEGIDLLEISGGNYEQPQMMGIDGLEPMFEAPVRESTRAREAYFMAYAEKVLESAPMPIMVTGGFRTQTAMQEALQAGVAMIGVARPLCADADAPKRLLTGEIDALPAVEGSLRLGPGWLGPHSPFATIKAANGFGAMAYYYRNILRLGDGAPTRGRMNLFAALVRHQIQEASDAKQFR